MEEKEKLDRTRAKEAELDRTGLREVLSWFILLLGFVYGPLDPKLGIREALEKALRRPIPAHVNWFFCLGGITFFLFIIQAVSGTLLMFHYRPTVAEAFESVQFITNYVSFGWLIRGVHQWGSALMILAIFLHMLRVLFYGAYRPPRELNWVVGMTLLVVTLAFGFTGYLLPWNQTSYWATSIGIDILGKIPLIGENLKGFLLGGPTVSGATLTRFFVFHVLILPFTITFLLTAHFTIIRRQGISEPL